MARSRSEIQVRNKVELFGAAPRHTRPAEAPRFDWVGRGDVRETSRRPAPGLRHECRHRRIDILEEGHPARATAHLARIPEPSCSVHMITNGTFDFFDFISATIGLAAPRTVLEFYGSTWILNRRNGAALLDFLDRGVIKQIGLITGLYFKRREGAVYHAVYEGLRSRGQRFMAAPNHSKWFALLLDDGTGLVSEGSANFTENGQAEQVCVTNDRGLFDYYKAWAEDILGTEPLAPIGAGKKAIAIPDFGLGPRNPKRKK